ncbi:unnamed protein product [Blepharisma stoltei]|uniref:PX domain-containing protein n=1 Tax=Blepharisma stoltei TaxID=1481888 RepID=A0AAU9K8V9_9CILI|nr:unnamed protein product [Blepharisma stoltei]
MESEIEAQRKAKQEYLHDEIIGKNFDSETFISYCEKVKSSDIDNWTFEELQNCVENFQILYSKHDSTSESSQNIDSQECLYDTIGCQELLPTELTGQATKMLISISDPGLDRKSISYHIDYSVLTLPIGWNVNRKYPDFIWLRDALAVQFPSYYIPNLPNKKCKVKFSDSQLGKQQKFLEFFLEALNSFEFVKRSPIFIKFLKEENPEEFKDFKKQTSNKLRKSANLTGIFSVDGMINCDYNINDEFYPRINEYFTRYTNLIQKLSKEAGKIANQIAALNSSIVNFSEISKSLEKLPEIFSPNLKLEKHLYGKASESFSKWAEINKNQSSIINQYLAAVLKYSSHQPSVLIDLIKEKDQVYQDYVKNANKQKNLLEKNKPAGKDLLDLINLTKQRYGIFNNQSRTQSMKVSNALLLLAFNNFCEFSTKIMENNTKLQSVWVMLLDTLDNSKALI